MSKTGKQSHKRTETFSRNLELEALLKDLNASLGACERKLLDPPPAWRFPLVLIMGPMRSGTTLLMQWLANTGLAAYPSNLLSRFYEAPVIGAKIQLLLTDARYNFRDELSDMAGGVAYDSENGKTKGALAPNEFWYFWRRFLPEPVRDVWTDEELRRTMDVETLKAELAGIMDVFDKPFAAKAMLFNYHIPLLDSVLERVLFVRMRRDPTANVASVLDARRRQFGTDSAWYSFMIPEYGRLENLEPVEQVAGQVYFMDRAVDAGLSVVAEERKLVVDYEAFCANPEKLYHELSSRLGLEMENYCGPKRFEASNRARGELAVRIRSAVKSFWSMD